jgi:hypothetical protein
VEPETLLRRTVALTARALGLGRVHEAASIQVARRMLDSQPFDGARIPVGCIDFEGRRAYDLPLGRPGATGLVGK